MSTELVEEENRENSLHVTKSPLKPLEQSRTVLSEVLSQSQKDNQCNNSPAWDHIRQLDECENWSERTQVVTKGDHHFYLSCAQEFLEEMINEMPAESLQDDNNTNGSSLQDEFLEQQEFIEDNFNDDDFQTTSAQLDIDYLERLNPSTNDEALLALSRQSLYVKFDPLVGGPQPVKNSAERIKQLEQLNVAYQTKPNHSDLLQLETPPRTNSSNKSQRRAVHFTPGVKQNLQHDLLTATPEDPGLVHFDEGEEAVTAAGSTSAITQSSTVMPPINYLPETGELVKVLKYSDSDVAVMLSQTREELTQQAGQQEAANRAVLVQDYEQQLAELRHENNRLQSANDHLQAEAMLQFADKATWEQEVDRWNELSKKFQGDNTIMLEKYEEMKQYVKDTEKQRDQALLDFESLEKSFNELHQRYLKLKNVAQAMKKNEGNYKQVIAELEQKVRTGQEELETLKTEVDSKISEANKTFQQLRKEHASENAILKANHKKLTMQKDSLEKALQQKEQEKAELTAICEELMRELGDKQ